MADLLRRRSQSAQRGASPLRQKSKPAEEGKGWMPERGFIAGSAGFRH